MRQGRGTTIDRRSDGSELRRIGRRRLELERVDVTAPAAEPTDVLGDLEAPCLREDMFERVVNDLQNPLHTIVLETTLLDDKLAAGDADIRAALSRIARNVFYVDRLVQDLLDCCSIDSGHFELRRGTTELRALIARVVDRVVPIRDSGRVWVEASPPLTVSADALRIERVVANLIANALKYAPRSSLIGIRLEVRDGWGRISVIDDGPGMIVAETQTQYVFDRYRSGLGLQISKRIVEAHGGRISVDSVEGAGSCFYFELPMT